MKRFPTISTVLFLLFALGGLAASSAFAEAPVFLLALWLVSGAAVTTELAAEGTTVTELLLEDTKAILGIKAMILCSGTGLGLVSPESLAYVSETLSLTGRLIGITPLTELELEGTMEIEVGGLECTNQENCAEPLVWAVHLPYQNEVELMEVGGQTFFAVLTFSGGSGNPGWEIWCMGPNITDECTAAESVVELKLEGTTLLLVNTEAFTELAGMKLGTCTLGGAETGILEGEGTIQLQGNLEELTASSETSSA